jgi:hypothetical protein
VVLDPEPLIIKKEEKLSIAVFAIYVPRKDYSLEFLGGEGLVTK